MAQNREFYGEFDQLRAVTDGIRDTLALKTDLSNNSACAIVKEIAGELRSLRMEMKETLKEHEKKMEEMTKTQQLQNEKIEKISEELTAIRSQIGPALPIRYAILGKWKMIQHENWEGAQRIFRWSFRTFCEDIYYDLEDGKLKERGGVFGTLLEGRNRAGYGNYDLDVADNCLKTYFCGSGRSSHGINIDRYILDGKLHIVSKENEEVWKQIYMKI